MSTETTTLVKPTGHPKKIKPAIAWSFIQVKDSGLNPNPQPPKIHNDKDMARLQKSVKRFGLIFAGIANKDLTLIDGHSRIEITNPNQTVGVCVPNRKAFTQGWGHQGWVKADDSFLHFSMCRSDRLRSSSHGEDNKCSVDMAIDFNFVKTILREYSSDEQNSISGVVKAECNLDGLKSPDHDDILGLAYTYKTIIRLASGEALLTEKVGDLSRGRTSTMATNSIIEQFEKKYQKLLEKAGLGSGSSSTGEGYTRAVVV